MHKLAFTLLYFSYICTCHCSEDQLNFADTLSDTTFRILFVGNSLTYSNNLPELVKTNAKQKGINVEVETIAIPNYAIIDHWNDGEVQKEIIGKNYNFVVIQQGPSSQPYGRKILIEYGKKYSELCRNNGSKLAYFMVWPSLNNYQTFEGVINNHRTAAAINSAILCPVGEAWKERFEATNNFDYYSSDGFHPSLLGSQIAAEIIVASLFQQ